MALELLVPQVDIEEPGIPDDLKRFLEDMDSGIWRFITGADGHEISGELRNKLEELSGKINETRVL